MAAMFSLDTGCATRLSGVRDPARVDDRATSRTWTGAHACVRARSERPLHQSQRSRKRRYRQPSERDALVTEIARSCWPSPIRQPAGRRLPSLSARTVFKLAGTRRLPDLVVGYAKGTRGSDESALGALTRDVIVDNKDPGWRPLHGSRSVPGILLTNRALRKPARRLKARRGDPGRVRRRGVSGQGGLRCCSGRGSSSIGALAKVKRYATSRIRVVEEFITHALEKEIAQLEERLRNGSEEAEGLGYTRSACRS